MPRFFVRDGFEGWFELDIILARMAFGWDIIHKCLVFWSFSYCYDAFLAVEDGLLEFRGKGTLRCS